MDYQNNPEAPEQSRHEELADEIAFAIIKDFDIHSQNAMLQIIRNRLLEHREMMKKDAEFNLSQINESFQGL